jgi:hypothetical protein
VLNLKAYAANDRNGRRFDGHAMQIVGSLLATSRLSTVQLAFNDRSWRETSHLPNLHDCLEVGQCGHPDSPLNAC